MLVRRLRPVALFLLPVLLLHPLAGLSGSAGRSSAPLAPVPPPESLAEDSAAGKGLLEARRRAASSAAASAAVSSSVTASSALSSPSSAAASAASRAPAVSPVSGGVAPAVEERLLAERRAPAAGGSAGSSAPSATPTERLLQGAQPPDTVREREARGAEGAKEWLRGQGYARAERAVGRAMEMALVPAIDEALRRLSRGAPVRVDSTLAWDIREGVVQGGMEAFVPFARTERSTWFVQPGFLIWSGAGDERRHDMGIGVGRRALVGDVALGGALFYDYSVDAGHQRLGLSMDVQAERLYGAVNAYVPLSDWRSGRRGAGVRYRERALGGLELRLHYAASERLELFGSGSIWRRHEQETGRRTGWRPGGSVGLTYQLFSGLALSGRYELVEGAGLRNRYEAWLDWTVPATVANPFHHPVDLYRPVERERRLLYAEQAQDVVPPCAVMISVSHNRVGQTAALGEIDTVLFTAELTEAPVGCAGLPAQFALESSAPPLELVFRDADGDGRYQGEETRVMQSWPVPTAVGDLPRAWYDTGRGGLAFAFAPGEGLQGLTVPVQVQVGATGAADAPLVLLLSLPSGPGGDAVVLPETVAFGPDARNPALYTRTLAEAEGTVTTPVTISALPESPATFAVTATGTAGLGTDYTLMTTELIFAPGGRTTENVTLSLVDDTSEELDEELVLGLSPVAGYSIRNMARLTIVSADADPAGMPVLGLTRTAQRAREGTALVLELQLSRALDAPGSVAVGTSPDTAEANDYTAPPETLALAAGATRFTLTLATVADAAVEGDETLTLTLMAIADAPYTLARAQATLTITDDEQPAIAFGMDAGATAPLIQTVAESAGEVVVPVSVSHLPATAAAFALVVGGSAVQGTDYTLSATSLTFAPGDTLRQNITITLTDDTDAEADETITLALMRGTPGSVQAEYARGNRVAVTIAANDPVLQFSAPAVSVTEGDSVRLTVRLSSALAEASTVSLAATGTAGADDYVPLSGTLALVAGQTAFVIELATRQDGLVEGDETLMVTLTAIARAPYTLGAQTGIDVTIIDDDTPGVTVDTDLAVDGAQQTPLAVVEGAAARYTMVLNSQPTHDVRVTPASSDPAVAVPNPLIFTPRNWDTRQTVVVRGAEDGDIVNESVTVSHTAAGDDVNYQGITIADVMVSVTDNDMPGVTVDTDAIVSGVQTALTVIEGAMAFYTVMLDSEPTADVMVMVSNGDDTAVALRGLTGGALTFTATSWDTAQTVTVDGVEEDLDFDSEQVTLSHTATSSDGSYNNIRIANVTVNVNDNDLPSLEFSAPSVTVAEGGTVTLRLQLNGRLAQASRVNVGVNSNTADRNDYTAPSTPLMLAAGETDFTIELVARQDSVVEGDETLTVTLSVIPSAPYTLGTQRSIDVTISDDDTAGVVVDTDPAMTGAQTALVVTEGNSARYTVVLTSQPTDRVTVMPVSGDNTALPVGSALTFTATDWNIAQTVQLRAAEDSNGVNEAVTVSHTVNSRDANYDGITIADVMVTVNDNDRPTLEFTAATARVTEGGTVTLSLALSPVLTAASSVSVAVDVSGDNTAESGDFTPLSAATLDLAAATGNFTLILETREDTVVEGDETLTVRLGIPTGITSYILGERGSIEVTISDNETPTIAFGSSAGATMNYTAEVAEADGRVEVPVTLSALPETDTAFAWMVSGDAREGADYATITTKAINFSATGATTQTITISLTDDSDAEADETLTLTFTAPGNDLAGEYSRSNFAILTITSEDLPTLGFSAATASINEGNALVLTLRLSGPLSAASSVSVAVDVSGSNTAEMADFTPPAPLLTLPANVSSVTVTLATVSDAEGEGRETLTVSLGLPPGVMAYTLGAQESIVVTITDGPAIVLSPTRLEVREGGTATYSVRLSTAVPTSAQPIDVLNTSSDIAAATIRPQRGTTRSDGSVNLVIRPNQWNQARTIIVTGVQDGDGRNEALTINLRAGQGGGFAPYNRVTATLAVSVIDDDFPTLQFSAPAVSVAESAGVATLPVQIINGPLATPSSVEVMVRDGTATSTGSMTDYTAPATLALPRGVTSIPLTVAIAPDSRMEGSETFTVSLAAIPGAPYNLGRRSSIEVTITDVPELAFSAARASVAEGDVITLTVQLNSPLAVASSVNVAPTPDTAETADFIAPATSLALASGATTFRFLLDTVEDADVEGNETLTVTLASVASAPYTLGAQRSIAVTITDDDTTGPGIVVRPISLQVNEEDVIIYNVRLQTRSLTNVAIAIRSSDPDAVSVSGGFGSGETTTLFVTRTNEDRAQSVFVRGVADADRDNERITLFHRTTASSGVYQNLTGPGVPVTVLDNDRPVLRFSAARASIAESAGAVTLTVQIVNNTLAAPGSVQLMARDGSAVSAGAGADYTAPVNTLNLAAGADNATVTVAIAEDSQVEGNETFTVSLAATPSAPYELRDQTSIEVTISDNEAPAIAFGNDAADTANYRVTVAEDVSGGQVALPITVNALPVQDITFAVQVEEFSSSADSNDYSLGAGTVSFAPDGPMTRNFILTLRDDSALEGEEILVLRMAVASNPVDDLGDLYTRNNRAALIITDDDAAGTPLLSFSQNEIAVLEGDTLTLTVRLSEPLTVASSVRVGTTPATALPADYTPPATSLTLAANTDSVTFTLDTVEDRLDENNEFLTVSLAAIAGSPPYALGTQNSILVLINDDDTEGIFVDTDPDTPGSQTTLTVREGDTASYTVALTADPGNQLVEVRAHINGSGGDLITYGGFPITRRFVGSSNLVWGRGGWMLEETVMVRAIQDDNDTDASFTIRHSTLGNYGRGAPDLLVRVTVDDDDDEPAFLLDQDALRLVEGGGAGRYTVRLQSLPAASVTLTPVSDDSSAVTVSSALTFTPANWRSAQTVVVSPVNDADAVSEMVTISHTVTTTDPDYRALASPVVRVTLVDDEAGPGIVLTPATLTVPEGGTATYTVHLAASFTSVQMCLNTQPSPPVALNGSTNYRPFHIRFDAHNPWHNPTTLTVSAPEDNNSRNERTTIVHGVTDNVACMPDPNYRGASATLMITVEDND